MHRNIAAVDGGRLATSITTFISYVMHMLGEHDCWSKQVTFAFTNISSA